MVGTPYGSRKLSRSEGSLDSLVDQAPRERELDVGADSIPAASLRRGLGLSSHRRIVCVMVPPPCRRRAVTNRLATWGSPTSRRSATSRSDAAPPARASSTAASAASSVRRRAALHSLSEVRRSATFALGSQTTARLGRCGAIADHSCLVDSTTARTWARRARRAAARGRGTPTTTASADSIGLGPTRAFRSRANNSCWRAGSASTKTRTPRDFLDISVSRSTAHHFRGAGQEVAQVRSQSRMVCLLRGLVMVTTRSPVFAQPDLQGRGASGSVHGWR